MKEERAGVTVSIIVLVLLGAVLLAAVAPSYLDARIRNRLARVKTDLAHLAAAIEAYQVDNGNYPNDYEFIWPWYPTYNLTTPVPYVSADLFRDPMRREYQTLPQPQAKKYRFINYPANDPSAPWKSLPDSDWRVTLTPSEYTHGLARYGLWRVSSCGPDGLATNSGSPSSDPGPGYSWFSNCMVYDPTNGMVSIGDIMRCQKTGEVTSVSAPE